MSSDAGNVHRPELAMASLPQPQGEQLAAAPLSSLPPTSGNRDVVKGLLGIVAYASLLAMAAGIVLAVARVGGSRAQELLVGGGAVGLFLSVLALSNHINRAANG
jgi:hypothetical protein